MAATTLAVTLSHAIAYMTLPLVYTHPAKTVSLLKAQLEANLTAQFQQSWYPSDPLRGSGRRCLTFSPRSLPARPVYNACVASGVQWQEWILLFGGSEFDLFIDPGRISMRVGSGAPLVSIWSAEPVPTINIVNTEAQLQDQFAAQARARAQFKKKFDREILICDDESDDEIFSLIAEEMAAPTWMTPVLDKFPSPPMRSDSPLSVISAHSSRSSSGSEVSDNSSVSSLEIITAFTATRSPVTYSPASSISSVELPSVGPRYEIRARQTPRVFVDTSKREVTPYDSGKVGVLTGGVMLGSPKSAKPSPVSAASSPLSGRSPVVSPIARPSWRSIRA